MEKKRERRRRDLLRKKAAVKRYGWFDPAWHDARSIGINANTNHSCAMCGHRRRLEGATIAERRRAQTEE